MADTNPHPGGSQISEGQCLKAEKTEEERRKKRRKWEEIKLLLT